MMNDTKAKKPPLDTIPRFAKEKLPPRFVPVTEAQRDVNAQRCDHLVV